MTAGVVAYASLRHYADHLAPVITALHRPELRGVEAVLRGVEAPQGRPWGDPLRPNRDGLIYLVASYADAMRVAPTPVIYLEHGAGQSYHGDPRAATSGSYAGGDGLENVVLFLCPNESVADRWRVRYPATPAAVVGCPKLDHRHRSTNTFLGSSRSRTVAVSFHWPNPLCTESQWALPHYRPALADLAREMSRAGIELIGHGHPRAWRQLRREWARIGVEPVERLEDVFDRADLLAVDNSSAGPEFASLGRPIVWLSAPWYRRHVHHGGRFWTWTDGVPHVEEPDQLAPAIMQALDVGWSDGLARMVGDAYAHRDGRAAERAANAIMEVCRSCRTPSPPG